MTSGIINILHLRDTDRICGPGKTILETVARIDKSRFNALIGVLTRDADRENAYIEAAVARKIPVQAISAAHQFDLRIIFRIAQIVRERKIHIISSHEYKSDIIAFLVSKLVPVAIITTAHGWIRNSRKSRVYIGIQKRLFPRFDKVIAVSPKIEREVLAAGVRRENVELIFNAIVAENYRPEDQVRGTFRARYAIPENAVLIGNVGRLSPEKGQGDFLDAAAVVIREVPDAHFALIGDGPTRELLQAKAKVLGLERQVTFTGHLTDVRPAFRDMDLFALTSHTEGFPNVILESLCMGTPVVATDVGGVAEIVEDGVTGRLVAPHDVSGIALAIVRMLKNRSDALAMMERGRRLVFERYHFDRRVERIQTLYTEVFNGRYGIQ